MALPGGAVEHVNGCFNLITDRSHRTLHQRDQPGRADPHTLPARGHPLDLAAQQPGAKIQLPLMRDDLSVANIEGLIIHQQTDQFAVGDVYDRLPGLGVAVASLGVGQRTHLEATRPTGSPEHRHHRHADSLATE